MRQNSDSNSHSYRIRWASWSWLLACLAIAGFLWFAGSDRRPETSAQARGLLPASIERQRSSSVGADLPPGVGVRPIEELRVGDRVLAHNPLLADADRPLCDPVAEEWRLVKLAITKRDGYRLDIALLRPLEWLEFHAAEIGDGIALDIPQMNAYGMAELLSIEPCPSIVPGEGSVVTGTYRHTSGDVLNVAIDGADEPIGTTADHPFWSEDRQAFVEASTLQIGEHLRTHAGTVSIVTSISRRGPPEAVFNLEVYGENVYYVSDLGILVHNYNYGEYLKRHKGDPPTSMSDPHAHHVVVKGLFSNRSQMTQRYAHYSREVLRRHNIDPLKGLENLHWAPNRGHTNQYIKEVARELWRVEQSGGGRAEIVAKLSDIAKRLNGGTFP